jgi:hypothetical protein
VLEPLSEFEILDDVPGTYTFASYHNVNIFVWVSSATGVITDRIQRIVAKQVPANPKGLSTIHVMTPLATPPSPEARRGFADIARRWHDSIVSASLVIEREGFWGSALRSAVTGIQMLLANGDYPVKVHGNVAEAAAWVATNHFVRSGVKLDATELLAALESARSWTLERAQGPGTEMSQLA